MGSAWDNYEPPDYTPSKKYTGDETWKMKVSRLITVDLWIGIGSYYSIERLEYFCQEFCSVGLCVTVTPTTFCFTNGREKGVRIGLRNYPRFPTDRSSLINMATELGMKLADEFDQGSFMLDVYERNYLEGDTARHIWYSRRGDI